MGLLNKREEKIASLITQLAEYANDESDTQGVINGLMKEIQKETNQNIKEEMEKAKSDGNNKTLDIARRREYGRESLPFANSVYNLLPIHQNSIVFTRIREVKKPCKAHPTDAGIDFYVPDEKAWDDEFKEKAIKYSNNPVIPPDGTRGDFVEFIEADETIGGEHISPSISVLPGGHIAIPSGIKTIIPQGFGMMMVNKSGVATKMKLSHSACLIDSEYRDELIFCFFNHSTEPIAIKPGMKITQGLIVPILNFQLDEVVNRVYEDMGKDTNRGGGFGSSGDK